MKAMYTVTVTRNSDGEQILDFDLANLNYKIETSHQFQNHIGMNGSAMECIARPVGTVTISGSFLTETKAELVAKKAGPCEHDWVDYRGLSEEFKVCGICGSKK